MVVWRIDIRLILNIIFVPWNPSFHLIILELDGTSHVVIHLEDGGVPEGADEVVELRPLDAGRRVGAYAEGHLHFGEAAFVDEEFRVRMLSANAEIPMSKAALF